ncbi:MAG: metalloregulator ArsR/SmtB family transcription factor [Anaerolineaceae bacterium]
MNTIEKQERTLREYARQAELLKALGHPARLAILDLLRDGPHCVCHLEAHLGLRQAYISQQLAVLRAAGLVDINREGWNVYYAISEPAVFALLDATQGQVGGANMVEPGTGINCPCPKCSSEHRQTLQAIPVKEKNAEN